MAKVKDISSKVKKGKSLNEKNPIQKAEQLAGNLLMQNIMLPRKVVQQIAEEVGKVVSKSMARTRRKKKVPSKKVDNPIYLDTSAIIDTRVFELMKLGVFIGNFVVLEGVLKELKNIADSKDNVKKERGRRALDLLDQIKKQKGVKIIVSEDDEAKPVDDSIIFHAKKQKGRIITCDYNLSKKAKISNVTSIDLYEMANILKTTALPGEQFYVKVIQIGKGEGQGVGYLPDGTMIVVEHGKDLIGKTVQVIVSRIIQTDAGKILFAKIKE